MTSIQQNRIFAIRRMKGALETNNEEANAKHKLHKKNADFVVLNSLRNEGTCFGTDNNQIEIISETDKVSYPKTSKQETARYIVDALARTVFGKQQQAQH